MPDVHDADRFQHLQRFAHRVAADAELIHELRLSGKWITGSQPALQDNLLHGLLYLDGSGQAPPGAVIIMKHHGHLLVISS